MGLPSTNSMGGGTDLTNLGYQVGTPSGPHVNWDPYYQYGAGSRATGGSTYDMGGAGGSRNASLGGNGVNMAGLFSQAQGVNPALQGLFSQQQSSWDAARNQMQQNWDSAKQGMLGVPADYKADPTTQGSNALAQNIMANPNVLSPAVIEAMRTQQMQGLQGQQANATRQQQGIMAADGQLDASSLLAASQANARNAMGAQVNANQNLDINAAQANFASRNQAQQLGQAQSLQNNNVNQQANNSIISNLPRLPGDDYSSMMSNLVGSQNGMLSALTRGSSGGGGGGGGGGPAPGIAQGNPMTGAGGWSFSQNGNQQGSHNFAGNMGGE